MSQGTTADPVILRFGGRKRNGRHFIGAGHANETAADLAERLYGDGFVTAEIHAADRLVGGIGTNLDTGQAAWWGEN